MKTEIFNYFSERLIIKPYTLPIILMLIMCLAKSTFAQQDTVAAKSVTLDKLTLRDGSTYIGTLVREDSVLIVIRLINNTTVEIPLKEVEKRSKAEGTIVRGQFLRPDPNQSRTFFGPTARTLKQGQGYFAVYELFIPYLGIGITDDIMIAGGTPAIPLLAFNFYYFGPKVRFVHSQNVDVAAGFVYSRLFEEVDGFGLAYAVSTLGNQRASVTVGYGTNFTPLYERTHLLMVSAEVQSSNSIKFITENWIPLSGGSGLASLGIRFFGEKVAADFGLLMPTAQGTTFIYIPWVGLSYNFGN